MRRRRFISVSHRFVLALAELIFMVQIYGPNECMTNGNALKIDAISMHTHIPDPLSGVRLMFT